MKNKIIKISVTTAILIFTGCGGGGSDGNKEDRSYYFYETTNKINGELDLNNYDNSANVSYLIGNIRLGNCEVNLNKTYFDDSSGKFEIESYSNCNSDKLIVDLTRIKETKTSSNLELKDNKVFKDVIIYLNQTKDGTIKNDAEVTNNNPFTSISIQNLDTNYNAPFYQDNFKITLIDKDAVQAKDGEILNVGVVNEYKNINKDISLNRGSLYKKDNILKFEFNSSLVNFEDIRAGDKLLTFIDKDNSYNRHYYRAFTIKNKEIKDNKILLTFDTLYNFPLDSNVTNMMFVIGDENRVNICSNSTTFARVVGGNIIETLNGVGELTIEYPPEMIGKSINLYVQTVDDSSYKNGEVITITLKGGDIDGDINCFGNCEDYQLIQTSDGEFLTDVYVDFKFSYEDINSFQIKNPKTDNGYYIGCTSRLFYKSNSNTEVQNIEDVLVQEYIDGAVNYKGTILNNQLFKLNGGYLGINSLNYTVLKQESITNSSVIMENSSNSNFDMPTPSFN